VEGVMVVGDRSAGSVHVQSGDEGAEVLLLGGQPLGEPVSRYGPFVMNTREEIIQAFDDYEAGRLGKIVASGSGISR
jgi:redox-sensitive bicupin YhaK (pirin superfamily)